MREAPLLAKIGAELDSVMALGQSCRIQLPIGKICVALQLVESVNIQAVIG